MTENINKQNEIPRLKRKKPKVYESNKQTSPEDRDDAPDDSDKLSRSYKGMDINALDKEYEDESSSSRPSQQRRNTGHPSKDSAGMGVFGTRGGLIATQLNASFHNETPEPQSFLTEESNRKRESRSLDARNLNELIDPGR